MMSEMAKSVGRTAVSSKCSSKQRRNSVDSVAVAARMTKSGAVPETNTSLPDLTIDNASGSSKLDIARKTAPKCSSGRSGEQRLPSRSGSRARSNSLPPSILKQQLEEAHAIKMDRIKSSRVKFSIPVGSGEKDSCSCDSSDEDTVHTKLPVLDIEIPRDPLPNGSDVFQQVLDDISTPTDGIVCSSVKHHTDRSHSGTRSRRKHTIKMTPRRASDAGLKHRH